MKLIWPGVFLGTGAVGTVGGLYGNSLYSKSVSRKEADVKFEEVRLEIEKFSEHYKDENVKDNFLTVLVNLWIAFLESKNNDYVEKLKESLEDDLKENEEKKEILKNLYKNMKVFVKFLKDNGIDISEYQGKIVNISISLETETLSIGN